MMGDSFADLDVKMMFNVSGIQASLDERPEIAPGTKAALIRRYGVDVVVVLTPDWTLSLRVRLGVIPQVGVPALFRKLLSLNTRLKAARFGLVEEEHSVWLIQFVRLPAKKDGNPYYEDFAPLLDGIVAAYHEHAPALIQEFQLQQPA